MAPERLWSLYFRNPDEEDLTLEGQNVGPKFWLSPEAHNRRLGCEEEINAASDVFQLAAIFWYVATGRHPTGILTEDDWIGPKKLFSLLHRSLYHDFTKRPQDGQEFSGGFGGCLNPIEDIELYK